MKESLHILYKAANLNDIRGNLWSGVPDER